MHLESHAQEKDKSTILAPMALLQEDPAGLAGSQITTRLIITWFVQIPDLESF